MFLKKIVKPVYNRVENLKLLNWFEMQRFRCLHAEIQKPCEVVRVIPSKSFY